MYSNLDQMDRGMDEDIPLFPFPEPLVDYNFSMSRRLSLKEKTPSKIEIEIKLISSIEFVVCFSTSHKYFKEVVIDGNPNLLLSKDPKKPNFEFNLKHYFFIISKIKYIHEHQLGTFNYNHLNETFIRALIKNVKQNDNILTFIQNPKSRKSIIQSLESDTKYGQRMKTMFKYKMFEDLNDDQIIAFYMSVMRNGKSILADREGKTLTALTIMTYFADEWPLVIVCNTNRKNYWNTFLKERYKCRQLFRIAVINHENDIFVYPKPFNDILIMDYDLYNEIKDKLSFRCLNIKAFIFEDQSRGDDTSLSKWRRLSQFYDNLENVDRIIFIWGKPFDPDNLKRYWPLLQILDPNIFEDYEQFDTRYCSPEDPVHYQTIKEFQILLKSTFLICNNPFE